MSSNTTKISYPLELTSRNSPTRLGQVIETLEDIKTVPKPFVGMIIYVNSLQKFIYVKTLKAQDNGFWGPIQDALINEWEYLNTGNSEGLNQLQLRVTTNEENIKTNTDNIAANATNIIQLNSSVDTLTTNLQTVQSQVSGQLSVINSELTTVKNNLSTVNQAVIVLHSDENTTGSVRYLIKEQINTKLLDTNNRISNVETQVASNLKLIQSNSANIESNTQSILTLNTRMTNVENKLDEALRFDFSSVQNLEGRVTTLETNYTKIDDKIDQQITQAFNWATIDQK